MLLWFWFIIGLFLTILGAFVWSYKHNLIIKDFIFDGEILGKCLLVIGAVLAGIMLFAIGIRWCVGG